MASPLLDNKAAVRQYGIPVTQTDDYTVPPGSTLVAILTNRYYGIAVDVSDPKEFAARAADVGPTEEQHWRNMELFAVPNDKLELCRKAEATTSLQSRAATAGDASQQL